MKIRMDIGLKQFDPIHRVTKLFTISPILRCRKTYILSLCHVQLLNCEHQSNLDETLCFPSIREMCISFAIWLVVVPVLSSGTRGGVMEHLSCPLGWGRSVTSSRRAEGSGHSPVKAGGTKEVVEMIPLRFLVPIRKVLTGAGPSHLTNLT